MVTGSPMDKVVIVESNQVWEFANEVNGVLQQEPLFYVDSSHVDTYMYKAILVKREINNNHEVGDGNTRGNH